MMTLEGLYNQELAAMEERCARRRFDACGGLERLPRLMAAACSQEEVRRYIAIAAERCNQYKHYCDGRPKSLADLSEKQRADVLRQLGRPEDWNPQQLPGMISPQKALDRLAKGIKVKDRTGREITLDMEMVQHWRSEGKSKADIDNRLAHLDQLILTVQNANEVWEDKDTGKRTYLAAFVDYYKQTKGDNRARVEAVSFTFTGDKADKVQTFFPASRDAAGDRNGWPIYPKVTVLQDEE